MNTIYPLGTEQDPSGMRVRELMGKPDVHIIDCRINPWSWRFVWQKPTLTRMYGQRYHPAGKFLGNAKHPSNQMLPGRCEVELADPKTGIHGLCRLLEDGYDLILIDQYLELQDSHVEEILRRLEKQRTDVQILLPEITSQPPEHFDIFPLGTKVTARIAGKAVPAIVLSSRWSQEGNYDQCHLRVAAWSELERRWQVADYNKPVQSYRLKRRYDHIRELDGPLERE
jgi:hypothetical protein